MKHPLLFAAISAAFIFVACNKPSEEPTPAKTKQVTFTVQAFSVTTQPMQAPAIRKAQILDDEGGNALTDLYIFEGSTQLAHQTSDMDDFGTVTLTLEYGNHNLSFVATRSDGITIDGNILKATSLRPTFGKLQAVTVGDATDEFDITLTRITGQMILTIEDAIPNDAAKLTIQIAEKYNDLNMTNFNGANVYAFSQDVNITSKQGQTNQTWTLNILSATYGDQYTTNVTLSVYRSDDSLISQHVIANVPLATNTKTLLTGKMFSGQAFTVTADVTWEYPINGVW